MGTFTAEVGVSDGNGGPVRTVEASVDTGATWTVLPDSLLRDLGVRPAVEQRTFTYADGRRVVLSVGQACLSIEGEETFNRVVFGADGQYLLGATTLQNFGLVADTTKHRLVPAGELLL